jgi:hypothetical protein
MILKLANEKVEVQRMEVPELIKETSIHYVFESNTEHLHPVITIGDKSYKDNHIILEIPNVYNNVIHITVTLYDDNQHVIRIYRGELAYNKYQITGTKPVRPDFEKYIQSLELKILTLEKDLGDLIIKHNEHIKELEEKGEII